MLWLHYIDNIIKISIILDGTIMALVYNLE